MQTQIQMIQKLADEIISDSRKDAHTQKEEKAIERFLAEHDVDTAIHILKRAAKDSFARERGFSLCFILSTVAVSIALKELKLSSKQSKSMPSDTSASICGRNVWDKDVKQLFDDLLLCHVYLRECYGNDFYFPEHKHLCSDFNGWSRVLRKVQALYEADKVASAPFKAQIRAAYEESLQKK